MSDNKGIFDSVLGVLFENSGGQDAPPVSAPAEPVAQAAPPRVVTTMGGTAAPASRATDSSLIETIRANTFGIASDYASFAAAAKLLEEIIPDETMRFKAALASSKIPAAKIADALQSKHVQALEAVAAAYRSERDSKFKVDVQDKLDEAARLGSENQDIENRIAKMQNDILENRKRQAKLTGSAETARVMIEGTDGGFENARQVVAAELAGLADRIKTLN
jgi:flagellar motor protein MotB